MKKQMLFIMAGLLAMSGVSLATDLPSKIMNSPHDVMAPVGVWIKISITFHRPKLDCLQGFGLCFDFTYGIDGDATSSVEKGCPVSMKIENDKLIMQVTENSLSSYENGTTLPYFAGKTSITLEDNTALPPGVSRELGSSTPIVIKAGTYPVTYQNRIFTVIFQL